MTWVKLDDRFHGNRKIRQAWKKCRASIGLYAMGLTHSSQHKLDGHIEDAWVTDQLQGVIKSRALSALLESGLWTRTEHGYLIHDFLEYNKSRADLALARRKDAKRKESARRVKTDVRTDANVLSSPPAPPRPAPLTTTSKSLVDDSKIADPEIVRLCDLLADLIWQRDPKTPPKPHNERWLRDMRLLVHKDRGGDVAEVERILHWSQADPFWQSNILSPAKLREHFSRLLMQSRNPQKNGLPPVADSVARGGATIRSMLKTKEDQ